MATATTPCLLPKPPFSHHHHPWFHPFLSCRVSSIQAAEKNPSHHAHVEEAAAAAALPHPSSSSNPKEEAPTTRPSRRSALIHAVASSVTLAASSDAGRTKENCFLARALDNGTGGEKEEGKRGSSMDSSVAVLQSRICSFSLANGMKWIVLERHNAPVVSCYTHASVGASSEEDGFTGLAHLLVCVIHLSFFYLFIYF